MTIETITVAEFHKRLRAEGRMKMEINQERIESAIIADVADKIIGDDGIYQRAKTAIDARVDALWKSSVAERLQAAVSDMITSGFEREYQKIDSFGGAKGNPTTIRAELERLIGGYWNERVDQQGKPTASSYSSVTRAEWLMAKMCADDFSKTMNSHIINVSGGAQGCVQA